jgi:hypothetical protein
MINSPATGLWLRALGHEFVQIARAIIYEAHKLKIAPLTPQILDAGFRSAALDERFT